MKAFCRVPCPLGRSLVDDEALLYVSLINRVREEDGNIVLSIQSVKRLG